MVCSTWLVVLQLCLLCPYQMNRQQLAWRWLSSGLRSECLPYSCTDVLQGARWYSMEMAGVVTKTGADIIQVFRHAGSYFLPNADCLMQTSHAVMTRSSHISRNTGQLPR